MLSALPRRSRQRLIDACETVELAPGAVLCEPRRLADHVWFPLTGFISLVAPVTGHPPLEIGLIGNEGMLGATLALGVANAPLQGVVQGVGEALRMPVAGFRRELRTEPALPRLCHRYLYVQSTQFAQSVVCGLFHDVDARLSRWLLMTDDRSQGEDVHLTHQFLAGMLGVQRSAVTIAAGRLQDRGLIRYARGNIVVLDRRGLEAAACECYARTVEDYAALLR